MTQYLIYGLVSGTVYMLVGIGFVLIFRATRFFHFAHGAIYVLGAYFAYFFSVQLGLERMIAFPLACICALIVGVGCEIVVYKKMRDRKATDLTLLIASLGLYIVLQNIVSMVWGDETKTMRTGVVMEGHELFGARITDIQIMIIITSVVLIILMSLVLTRTKFGKAVRGLANDPELARLSGINSDRYIMYTYALGSFLAAFAAIIISFDTDITPTMGFNALVKGVIAAIIGGIGSLFGVAFGALFIGLAENIGVYWLPSKWQDTIAFVLLILFLLFRPYGILGKKSQKAQI